MKLTEEAFELFAAQHYCNPTCLTTEEFDEDLKKIHLIKRLLKRNERGEHIPVRLLLNHIIIFYNVFDINAATGMLLLKLKDSGACLGPLKTCLIYLNLSSDECMSHVYPDLNMRDLIRKEVEECHY
tara:strand:- start:10252 stop:10632 length:381 start_codon:yes stop_codon:yes gene_type:complete